MTHVICALLRYRESGSGLRVPRADWGILDPEGNNLMPRPPKSKAKRRVGLAVYLEPAVLRRLKHEAERDRRSTSTQAALYIEDGLGLRRNTHR